MNIIDIFQTAPEVKKYLNIINRSDFDLLINNTTSNHNYLLAYLTYLKSNNFIVYVASNVYKATAAYEAISLLAGYENVNFYVADEVISTELLAVSNEFKFERIHTINSILKNEKKIIVTHVNALTRALLPKEKIISHILHFQAKDTLKVNEVIQTLIESGYRKVPITSMVGEFSVRGGIIDVFPINSDIPYRLDLFDDEIEFIKTFDVVSQKTINKVKEIEIYPINELVYKEPDKIIEKIKKDCPNQSSHIINDLDDIKNYNNLERLQKYINYFSDKTVTFLDYIDDKIVFYDEVKRLEEAYQKATLELTTFLKNKHEYETLNLSFLTDYYGIFYNIDKKIYLNEFKQSLNNYKINEMLDLNGYSVIDYQNDIRNLLQDIKVNKKTVIIATFSSESQNLLYEIFQEDEMNVALCQEVCDIKTSTTNLIVASDSLSFGFFSGLEVINEANIFKKMKLKKTKYRSAYQNTVPITTKDDLKPGEYVVHYDYGIGQYLGIKTVNLKDVKNDYITIKFANVELYIPVENINLLEKYQGTEGSAPKLTTIGTNEWEKKKKKVREKLESIARELIELQAIREEKEGYKYQEDDYIQKEFEDDFEFVETADQLKAVETIKKDMESGLIVDRLVCGDVGYGKTEVAMRIAMKTVLNGKQVAYLAPTTILTRQHYYSFKERFEKFGINVELINRFVSVRKQNDIINKLRTGEVDIIIGTHALLNTKIVYKDLGLLIVDEEQRFGVSHKEKIKHYKNNVNVITLTATPIPRTLQMSIVGVRQLSLIETPPQNRYPVQTYVLEENEVIVKEAIYRELARKGQVFYLHNRIVDLDRIYRRLKRLVPEAKILVAHGQMEKNELEDAIQAFIDKEYDILLCTTIIESGIDIPNTNTLIVDMADHLGLAQMYQIRGRVGRSDRVSYAYFMFEEDKVLTDASAKRLNAIKEFTTLGSGYKIAVRDLAIRGAGDILGREQSGFIDSVGLDMYMKLLGEAIDNIKGVKKVESVKKSWNVEVSKHVSDDYVSDDDIKIYIHKQISKISTRQERDNLIDELNDRFGKISEEVSNYIDKQYLESLLTQSGIDELKEQPNCIKITFSDQVSQAMDGAKLFKKAYEISPDFSFEYRHHRIIMNLTKRVKDKSWIKKIIVLLESFCI